MLPFSSSRASGQRSTDPGLFVCESPEVVRLLLASPFEVTCIVCTPTLLAELAPLILARFPPPPPPPPAASPDAKRAREAAAFPFPVVLHTKQSIANLAGWASSRGVLASGRIPGTDE
ncbi:hypothetical protein TeGR_g4682 [Tetraparma gracilis]|uniref:Uncharacterized protein n=1 Tax=Tetraparma gracilis TaxID=2962635 RepID=A0ABQ6MZ76_9STRA|nr:hypothetical protein TeGR_g4682 [Tetraparma gracilis]